MLHREPISILFLTDQNGFTALLYATNKSDYALIERLLEAGAEIEAKDKVNRRILGTLLQKYS
jgi:ankyrin repeat protein